MSAVISTGTVLGDYRLSTKLGAGGMGAVFRGEHTGTGKSVAVKVAHPSVVSEEHGAHRFEREIRAITRLNHPNIVSVYHSGQAEGGFYYVMELIDGCELGQYVRAPGLEWNETYRRLQLTSIQICSALGYIHSQRIVHRDLKPGNIMVTKDGVVKLMDFGLIKERDSRSALTATGMIVGTADYMAPEQGSGKPIDQRTDLYSLGVILYEMLAGRKPFEADSVIAVIIKHIQETALPPSRYQALIPLPLEEVVLKLLEKDPLARFQTAEDLQNALTAAYDVGEGQLTVELPSEAVQAAVPTQGKNYLFKAQLAGREKEGNILREVLDDSRKAAGVFVLVSGEAGVGKSRLVEEILSEPDYKDMRVFRGRCFDGMNVPYQLFGSIFDRMVESLKRRQEQVPQLLGEGIKAVARVFPVFEEIPYVRQLPALVELPPKEERIRLFGSLKQLFQNFLQADPIVLVLENLQWADDGSLELLRFLLETLLDTYPAPHPLILAGTYRDEEVARGSQLKKLVQQVARSSSTTQITLNRLREVDVSLMLQQMLGVTTLPGSLLTSLYGETGGNPFFIEEFMNTLLEEGVLYRKEAKWHFKIPETGELTVPTSIKEIVRRRLEQLSEEEQNILTIAAVIGDEFDFDVLMEVSDTDEDDLLDLLDALLRSNFLVEKSRGGDEIYVFYHTKIRGVLYEELSPRRKRRYHLKIGECLETKYRKNLDKHYNLLAHHFYHSSDTHKAFEYNVKAGTKAKEIFLNAQALFYYLQALEVFEEARDEFEEEAAVQCGEVRVLMGEIKCLVGEYDEAEALYRQVQGSADLFSKWELRSQVLHGLGEVAYRKGQTAEALQFYTQYLDESQKKGDQVGIAEASMGIGNVRLFHNEYDLAAQSYTEALGHQNQADHPSMVARLYSNLGSVFYYRRNYEEALRQFERAAEIAREAEEKALQPLFLNNVGVVLDILGRHEEARTRYRESLEIARNIGKRSDQSLSLHNLGYLAMNEGRFPEALDYYNESLQIKKELGDKKGQSSALAAIGQLKYSQAFYQEALQHFTQALAIAEEIGSPFNTCLAALNVAVTEIGIGDFEAAESSLKKARSLAEKLEDKSLLAGVNLTEAEFLQTQGKLEEARKVVLETYEKAQAAKLGEMEVRALVQEVEIALEEEDWEASRKGLDCLSQHPDQALLKTHQAAILFTKARLAEEAGLAESARLYGATLEHLALYANTERQWRAELGLARVLLQQNAGAEAREHLENVMDTLAQSRERLATEEAKTFFLNRPDRRHAITEIQSLVRLLQE